jgi:hypothetical protein
LKWNKQESKNQVLWDLLSTKFSTEKGPISLTEGPNKLTEALRRKYNFNEYY